MPGIGLRLALGAASPAGVAFSPASLGLSLYFDAAYSASPWTSTASAGTSGARSASEATNPPTAGSALGGKNSAVFNGTTSKLTLDAVMSVPFTAAAGGIVILYLANAGQAAQGANATADVDLISDSGGFMAIGVSASLVSAYIFDVADKQINLAATHNGSTWNAVKMRWNGTILEAGINSGAMTSTPAGNLGGVAGTVNIGKAFGAHFFPGAIRNILGWPTTPSNADLANVISSFNSAYGLAL